jgi:glycerol-3-phosphate acyltransferase PlsY
MLPGTEVIFSGTILMAVAYLLGSLPFSVWTGKIFYKIDVREHGSGNAGATNTWRVLGWKAGLPVLLLDIGKGFGATYLPYLFAFIITDPGLMLWFRIGCGMAAAIGHIYPVFAGFNGGKAVATLLGVIIGLMPLAAAGSLTVFILTFLVFRMVSLGSVLAAISLPIMSLLLSAGGRLPLLVFSGLIAIMVIFTHRRNIQRIIQGEESMVRFRKAKENSQV